jgi:hypothetical protein
MRNPGYSVVFEIPDGSAVLKQMREMSFVPHGNLQPRKEWSMHADFLNLPYFGRSHAVNYAIQQ